jgi:predicted DCC family thiol-disulfide oxidoreductase YuxK
MTETRRPAGGWTGGQYSLVRALTALLAAPHLLGTDWAADPVVAWSATGLASVLLAMLLVGMRARTVAVLLVTLEAARLSVAGATPPDSGWAALMLLHAFVPSAPYGSWDARGRVDPRGAWRMPYAVMLGAAVGAIVHLGWRFTGELPGADGVLRIAAWLCLGVPPFLVGARRPGTTPARLYYDGTCGLCHGAVRFLLAEDRDGQGFRFAPLDSDAYRAAVPEATRDAMPETMVLLDGAGETRSRWRGVLALASALGGWWRLLAAPARLLPRRAGDFLYDRVAAVRHRWFARPGDVCPLLPDELRSRFDLS